MIVLKRNRDQIENALSQAFLVSGLSTASGLAKEQFETISGILDTDYVNLYSLERNTRIDRANTNFLDLYGLFYDEPRASTKFARVENLDNVSIFLTNPLGQSRKGKEVTLNGEGIPIRKGTVLLNRNNRPLLRTTETVFLKEERVFVKCIAVSSDINTIAAETLAGVQLDLLSNPSVDSNLLGNFVLGCSNIYDISNSSVNADDETYRFVLYSKGQSVNLISEDKINTILDNLDVVQLIVEPNNPSSSGIVIYVETKNVETDSLVLQEVKAQLQRIFPDGTYLVVRPLIYSTLSVAMKISISPGFDDLGIREEFKRTFISNVNLQRSNLVYNFNNLLVETKNMVEGVRLVEFDYIGINNRKLLTQTYTAKKIEKLFAYPDTITYKI